jgi:plastocyanin
MNRFGVVVLGGLLALACTGASNTPTPPPAASTVSGSASAVQGCSLTSKIADHGTARSVTSSVMLEVGDYFFGPTCTTGVKPGLVTITLRNTTAHMHNFSIPPLGIDTDIPGDQTVSVAVRVGAGTTAFYCKYHRTLGEQGGIRTT